MANKRKKGPVVRTQLRNAATGEEHDTITQSISFDHEIYGIMEAARYEPRIPISRSGFVRIALEEKFRREGRLK
jgi:hypothetical protein